jgi:hypothetical protein
MPTTRLSKATTMEPHQRLRLRLVFSMLTNVDVSYGLFELYVGIGIRWRLYSYNQSPPSFLKRFFF